MSSLLEGSHPVEPSSPQTPSLPIPSFQLRRTISGIPTELLIQTFDDRILVILTQSGKVGCLVQASLPQVTPLPLPARPTDTNAMVLPPSPDSILLTPLLGTPPNQTLHSLYTSQISTLIWWSLQEVSAPRRPVVVGLALRKQQRRGGGEDWSDDEEALGDGEREMFMGLMQMVVEWPGPGEQ